MKTRRKKSGAVLSAIAVSTLLFAGCGSSDSSTDDSAAEASNAEDYDKVRSALSEKLAAGLGSSDATFEITNEEIDCISKGLDIPVEDLSDPSSSTDVTDTETVTYRCMTSDTIRELMTTVFAEGPSASQIEATGADPTCVVDAIVASFDTWKAGDEPYTAWVSALSAEVPAAAQTCVG